MHVGVPTNVENNLTRNHIVDLNGAIKYTEAVVVQYAQLQQYQNKEIMLSVKSKIDKHHKGAVGSISIRFEDEMGNYISFLKRDIVDSSG